MTRNGAQIARVMEIFAALGHLMHQNNMGSWVDVELSAAQLKTLFVISESAPATISQVAGTLRVGLPTASHLVDRLVQQGLAQRLEDARDRRYTQVALTPAGAEMASRLRQGRRDLLADWLAQLAPEDLDALARGLAALGRVATEQRTEEVEQEEP